jgi:hypothetical protein
MTNEEKLAWLKNYLHNCLGEELPQIQDNYTFGYCKIDDNEVLQGIPDIIFQGRTIRTIQLDAILTTCESVEVLTKESFAVICTNDPILNPWYQWNLSRGRISL